MKNFLFIIGLILLNISNYAQQNVGIGTLTPNANAVLEIESTDKGVLIPRLTTAQRNTYAASLTNTENSMLVYDVNDSVFYYWKATVWVPIPGKSSDNQNLDSVKLNPTDSVLTVFIEDGTSASVDLKTAFDNTDNQSLDSAKLNPTDSVLTVFIEDGTFASVDLKTAFDNTDNQNLDSAKLNPTDSVLTVFIEDGTSASVDLKTAFDNTDNQNLTIVGDSLEISNGNKVLFIDNDTTNERIDSIRFMDDTLYIYESDSLLKEEIRAGEWADAGKVGMSDFVYARQALDNGVADTVVIDDDGKLGLGTSKPTEKLEINNGGIQLNQNYGIGFSAELPIDGAVQDDAGKIYKDPSFFGTSEDALVFEKTDINQVDPDGGIAFTMKGNDNIREEAMVIKGNKRVGINLIDPAQQLHINGNIQIGLSNNTLPAGTVDPPGWGNRLLFSGGPDVSTATLGGANSDNLYISRYNVAHDISELRVMIADNEGATNNDAFVIGSALSGVHPWKEYFRVQSNGFVHIGSSTPIAYPSHRLHVTSTANPLRLEGVQQGANSDSILSINATGVVRKVEQVTLPPGMISPFATSAAPDGWLIADGRAVSRTTYANLFAAIGTMYGNGNGTTTFNLPDYRGMFLRGTSGTSGNDPDAGTRTNRGDGTTGNNVGTKQNDDYESHNHQLKTGTGTPGTDIVIVDSPLNDGVGWEQTSANPIPYTGAPEAITYNRGGSETRPVNINVLYCIKF